MGYGDCMDVKNNKDFFPSENTMLLTPSASNREVGIKNYQKQFVGDESQS